MKIEIKTQNVLTKTVFLDGRLIDPLDFGEIERRRIESYDSNISKVCFKKKFATDRILMKYGIDLENYNKICATLEKELQSVLH